VNGLLEVIPSGPDSATQMPDSGRSDEPLTIPEIVPPADITALTPDVSVPWPTDTTLAPPNEAEKPNHCQP